MKRLVVLLGLALLVASCIELALLIGFENFEITIQVNRDGTFSFQYNGLLAYKEVSESEVKSLEEEAKKERQIKEYKYVGQNRFRLIYADQGTLEKPFYFLEEDLRLVTLEKTGPDTVSLKVKQETDDKVKEFYQKNAIKYGGRVTVKTDAQVLRHNAQKAPWFRFWGLKTYSWEITSLNDPAATMVLKLQQPPTPTPETPERQSGQDPPKSLK